MVTPLTSRREVDGDSLDAMVDFLIDAGVSGIFCLGSSGEVSFLTDAQRSQVIARTVARSAGRVPVLAGVIDTSAARVVEQIARAAEAGATYAVVTAPFYAKINDADIVGHYAYIAERSALPVVAYDIPVAVHSKLPVGAVRTLIDAGHIVALKDSSGQPGALRELVLANRAAAHPIALLTGTEVVVDADYLIGVDGAVPGLGNVDPGAYVRLDRLLRDGRWEEARDLQDRLVALFRIIACDPDLTGPALAIGAFKEALKHRGVIACAATAAPSRPLSDDARKAVHRIVDAHFTH